MIRALLLAAALTALPALARPPRLTLVISVDALGSDVLLRNRARLKGGLGQLLNQGAFFPYARYGQAECRTAPGHTTLSTGANPWRHGIVDNRWVERSTMKRVLAFADAAHPVLEAPLTPGQDSGPAHIQVETLADRLRVATQERGKAVAVSIKSHAAIPLAGRAGQAWWFDKGVGKFVTGTWYTKAFPEWMKALNARKLPEASFGKKWELMRPASEYVGEDEGPAESDVYGLGRTFPHPLDGGLPSPGPTFYQAFAVSPDSHDLLVEAAKAAIAGEGLGKDDVPDLLAVSFSGTDLVFHEYGPYSWEMQDTLLRLDKAMSGLIAAAERAAGGRGNLVIALSADHGGAAAPEQWAATGLAAKRVNPVELANGLTQALRQQFGGDVTATLEVLDVYLGGKTHQGGAVDAAVRRAAAAWLMKHPSVVTAVASDDLLTAPDTAGYLARMRKGYFPGRSGDVLFMVKPFHLLLSTPVGTSHGTPHAYDAQVPMLFAGKGVKPGVYLEEVDPVDFAPTLAALMELGMPASAEGKPRAEALTGR
ncbi:alkaline phosphatase family protein [Corallococcus macrosporus]|uniref:Phosphodiesterase n=1 Tax=Corallococcus macrosporus DSM 14697 TaxID=1189310 RepID=A0A250JY11_9BACT|nr:alkaline phosphatase family protein [Corallococcus macrosporus]ATB48744.1 phosphodiesterase [Corallococcus macrosporus DSM 14697]